MQWLCGKLPWEKDNDEIGLTMNPEQVHAQKEVLLSDLPLFMDKCFLDKKKPPGKLSTVKRLKCHLCFLYYIMISENNIFYSRDLRLYEVYYRARI